MASPFRVVFLLFIASFFLLGLYDYVVNYEENGCEMTYMYERPQYTKVPLRKDVSERFPRYGLYLYGEGKYARESQNLQLHGIPVLFIPGNAGSHRQVRSLGSVALQKADSMKAVTHFNYFSVDFDEDLSGIFGGVLLDQTAFVHECIKKILTLYAKASHPPKTVALVGHSMGGIIARGLFAQPTFDSTLVNTIITQATPHQIPVFNVDSYMNDYYRSVNEYWRSHVNTTLKQTTLVTTGGGWRDILVRPGLTTAHGIVPPERSISTNAMSMPRAWVSTDHLCHVWCKQVVMATQRSLFDIIDRTTKQIARNPTYRMNAFRHHFLNHSGPDHFKPTLETTFKLDPSIKWETRRKMSWKLNREKMSTTRYSVVPVAKEEEMAFVAISNINSQQWIGSCLVGPKEKTCPEVMNYSPWGALIPPMNSEKKVVHLSFEDLATQSHLVIVMPKSKDRTEVIAEVYNSTRRNLLYRLPSLVGYMLAPANETPSTEVILNRTEPKAVFYNITLLGLNMPDSAYYAHLITLQCEDPAAGDYAGSVMKFHLPWSHEDSYSFVRYGESGNLSVKLLSGRPEGYTQDPQLHLYLHPGCTYHVSLTRSWAESFGQFVRYYGSMLPAFVAIQVLMALSWQLKELDEEGKAASFCAAHTRWAQPYRVVPVAMMLRFLISYPEDVSLVKKLGVPDDDLTILTSQGVMAAYLGIFLYLISYACFELYAYFVEFVIGLMARVCQSLCARCCLSLKGIKVGTVLVYISLLLATVLAAFVCGALGIVIVYFIYLAKVIWSNILGRLQEENLGERAWSRFNVNYSLFLLILVALVLNVPSLVMWIKTIGYSVSLQHDPSRWTGVCISISALLLTFADFPRPITELYGVASAILYMSCVLMIMYAPISIYRISYFISANLLIISLPLVLLITVVTLKAYNVPPKECETSTDEEDDEKEEKLVYNAEKEEAEVVEPKKEK